MSQTKTVAIIGAGPVGLAAAAHVLEQGLVPVVLERGPDAAYAVRQWAHVQLFSPWEYNVDKAAAQLLADIGWNTPEPTEYPTGGELVERYLAPLATQTVLKDYIKLSSRVISVSRVGFDKLKSKGREAAPFALRYENGAGPKTLQADAIIDVSGTWFTPNPGGASGVAAIGEKESSARIRYGMPDVLGKDRARYEGKVVAVLGAGHSAVGTLLDLAKLKEISPATEPVWLLRGNNPAKAFGGGANDKLVARGELGSSFAALVTKGDIRVETEFQLTHISETGSRLRIGAGSSCCGRHIMADEVIVATGFRPDFDFLRELRLELDPATEAPPKLAPLIDPNEHSCGTVRPHGAAELMQPEPGLYFAGMKSYGRAPTFLMITGYEQVRSIAAHIAGDMEAAARVELELPETGVCTRGVGPAASSCCGGPVLERPDACCLADVIAKDDGKSGCGCG
ncbi:hypothetical protein V1291_004911 [Nitrobacteraceae bacterium AZCC 1564]